MSTTTAPQTLDQLRLEIYRLSQKKPFSKEDSSRADILLKLLESRDDHGDRIRELKHRALAAEMPLARASSVCSSRANVASAATTAI